MKNIPKEVKKLKCHNFSHKNCVYALILLKNPCKKQARDLISQNLVKTEINLFSNTILKKGLLSFTKAPQSSLPPSS